MFSGSILAYAQGLEAQAGTHFVLGAEIEVCKWRQNTTVILQSTDSVPERRRNAVLCAGVTHATQGLAFEQCKRMIGTCI